jgi:ribonuclease Z
LGGWKPILAEDIVAGSVIESGRWQVTAETANHGDGLGFPEAFLKRWTCLGYRLEAEGKAIAISGDTIACEGLDRLAAGADVLVQCCYLASVEMNTEHFRRLAQHTMACTDTVGKIASKAGVKTLVLTHHKVRTDDRVLEQVREEVAHHFAGRLIIGEDLMEIEV